MSNARRALQTILEQQRQFARAQGIEIDDQDRLADWSDNLHAELRANTRASLERDPARPLGEAAKNAPLGNLDSTLALVCNVFAPGSKDALVTLSRTLASSGPLDRLAFVHDLMGHGESAHATIALQLSGPDARPIIVHASFAEPYSQNPEPATALPAPAKGWGHLQGCRNLAMGLKNKRSQEPSFPIASTLRRIRTMTHNFGTRRFRYHYLWYDTADRAADLHRRDINRLRMRIGGDVDLVTETWQAYFSRLKSLSEAGDSRINYLSERYFPDSQ